MNFECSDCCKTLQVRLTDFMETHIIPRDRVWHQEVKSGQFPVSFMEDLKALAKSEGLWNLFLPSLRADEPGQGLSNLDYAPLAEIMGRIFWSSEVFNCSAPDTGNMELLHLFATAQQYERWLAPLLNGDIRSAFAMTEPDVASSDATNIQTSIRRDGGDYVVNGRKWFITNAAHPNCRILIVMGKTSPETETHRQQSMVMVPMDTPGVTVVRNINIINHISPEGHCEIRFENVRVPAQNLLGSEGDGFLMAQARLGPGRVHHCMRSIGQAEVALDLMCDRARERRTFGRYLSERDTILEGIARSRVAIEQARLLVLKTAWLIDKSGTGSARKEVSMIKAIVPQLQCEITDRAMQVFGAMGLSPDTPLPDIFTWGRALRIIDGPDEVHLRAIGRMELKERRGSLGESARYLYV